MPDKHYGQPITFAEAHVLANNSMEIKNKYFAQLLAMTKSDPIAERYYCGGDALYVFSKEEVQNLLDVISPQSEDCLVIYPASREDEPGRPTLMLFAYKYSASDNLLHIVKPIPGGKDGSEHPGGNGNITLRTVSSGSGTKYEIPEVINPAEITFALR